MIKKVKGWNPYITVLENENRVIIANRWNGQWMKISKECFDIILEILKKDAKEIAWEDTCQQTRRRFNRRSSDERICRPARLRGTDKCRPKRRRQGNSHAQTAG